MNKDCAFVRVYPELLLFDNEDKAFIVVGVQVAHLNRRLLLLPDSLPLPVQQLDLYVRIWRERERAFKERTLERKKSTRCLQTLEMYDAGRQPHAEI